MTALNIREANLNFAKVIQASTKAPVYIEEGKKNVAVVMSAEKYQELEDYMLLKMVDEIHKKGNYYTTEKSEELIRQVIGK